MNSLGKNVNNDPKLDCGDSRIENLFHWPFHFKSYQVESLRSSVNRGLPWFPSN